MPDAEVLSRLEKLAAEIEALHDTMGVLIDDVAELRASMRAFGNSNARGPGRRNLANLAN